MTNAAVVSDITVFALFIFVVGILEGRYALAILANLMVRFGFLWSWNATLVSLILTATGLAASLDAFFAVGIDRNQPYTLLTSALLAGIFAGALGQTLWDVREGVRGEEKQRKK